MSKLKISLLTLVSAAALFGAASASAASYVVWDGGSISWQPNGTTNFTGPTTATYLGNGLPCDANFTVQLTAGTAQVTAASFSGSAACAGIVAYNLPWPMSAPTPYTGANPPFTGAPTLTPPLYNVSISGVRIYLPPPLNVYCPSSTGVSTVTGVLDGANRYVFKATMGACSVQTRTNTAPYSVVANPEVRVIP